MGHHNSAMAFSIFFVFAKPFIWFNDYSREICVNILRSMLANCKRV